MVEAGTHTVRAGFAGQDAPLLTMDACVARSLARGEVHAVGKATRALSLSEEHELTWPMLRMLEGTDPSQVEEDVYTIIAYIYQQLDVIPKSTPVVWMENTLEGAKQRSARRQLIAKTLFDRFNCPAIHICSRAVGALFAAGELTGLVIQVGDFLTEIVPVFQGFPIRHAGMEIHKGSKDISALLQQELTTDSSLSERVRGLFRYMPLVHHAKENMLYVSPLHPKVDPAHVYFRRGLGEVETQPLYELPDGEVIELSQKIRTLPDIFFDPTLADNGGCRVRPADGDLRMPQFPELHRDMGLHEAVQLCVDMLDQDTQPLILHTVVLSGGGSLIPGMAQRLENELNEKLHHISGDIEVLAPPDRQLSAWIGGSIVGTLPTFRKLLVTQKEFQENADVVNVRPL